MGTYSIVSFTTQDIPAPGGVGMRPERFETLGDAGNILQSMRQLTGGRNAKRHKGLNTSSVAILTEIMKVSVSNFGRFRIPSDIHGREPNGHT
jgi:hypothetical protein